jgi:hypothetical protein
MTAEELVLLLMRYFDDNSKSSLEIGESLSIISQVLLQFYAMFELLLFCGIVCFTVRLLWWLFWTCIFKDT